jgi:N-acetylneuraminic acid mutarotase
MQSHRLIDIRRAGAVVVALLLLSSVVLVATLSDSTEAAGTVLYRVNSGGAAVAGSPAWSTDTKASPSPFLVAQSATSSTASVIDMSDPSLPAGTPSEIFQAERYDAPGKSELTYAFPTTPGDYEVRLYFAEIYAPAFVAGARVFDVTVEDAVVLDNFDVFAQAGNAGNKAIMRSFVVSADDDIDIQLLHGVENPALKAIEILTGDGTPGPAQLAVTPSTLDFGTVETGSTAALPVTVSNTAASGSESLVVSGTTVAGANAGLFSDSFVDGTPVTLAPGESTVIQVTFAPTAEGGASAALQITHDATGSPASVSLSGTGQAPTGGGGAVLYRVNSGGAAVAGSPAWSTDTKASPSPFLVAQSATSSTASVIDMSDPSLPAGTPSEIFQAERYDAPGKSELTYAFPTTPGDYEVRLYFAEIYAPAFVAGARVFDVTVEDAVVLDNFDVFAQAGNAGNKAIMRSFVVSADDDIDIQLLHGVENPALKAIEIISGGGTPGTPQLGASPSTLNFGSVVLGSAKVLSVDLTNTASAGSGSLDITSTQLSGAGADLFADSFADGSSVTLAPGASSSVDVTYAPDAAASASATLEIHHTGTNSPLLVSLSGSGSEPQGGGQVSFGKSAISGLLNGAGPRPTSLAWGPDGRLYVAHLNGTITVATVERNGPNDYAVSSQQTISLLQSIPNHNDDGALNPALTGRLVTGLDVVGTAQNPIIYLVSSDPRIGSPATGDLGMDTNSGVLSRIEWNGTTWVKTDLVRGLPRSKEQHSVQGVIYKADTNDLLLTAGGQTNHGAPSDNFQGVPEYALSAAILTVDLDAIGNTTYDLPTLDDEDRAGVNDANDPFGGNDGKNQARLVPGGPVQVYAAGLRNPYDAVLTPTGLYTIDNGGNFSWGGAPAGEGPSGVCTNALDNTGPTLTDSLHRITGPGTYGGHPNPTRGNMANTFNSTNPQSPVSVANPIECDWLPNSERGALAFFPTSTNGIAQFTTDNFGGELAGDLLAAGWDNKIYRIDLDTAGTSATSTALFSSVGAFPLDVIGSSAADPFPGTILVADYGARVITIFEPADFDGGGFVCTGADDPGLDEDSDGFSNADEIDNGTDPCSGGDVPTDFDSDGTSDLNDPDDDNDGIPDVSDRFALDAGNGLTTPIPVDFPWDSDTPLDHGILNLGLTGSMTNGSSDWLSTYDIDNMTVIGAAGVVTVDAVPNGDALGASNDQQYGLQFGFDARPASASSFEASTSLPNPFGVDVPLAGQSWGLQVGTGTQSDYVKLVLSGDNGGELQLVREVGDVSVVLATAAYPVPGPTKLDLFIWVDPDTGTVEASYTSTSAGVTSDRILLGSPFTLPSTWFDAGFATGLIATSGGAASPLSASWDFLRVLDAPTSPSEGGEPPPPPPPAEGTWATLAAQPRNYESVAYVELDGYLYAAGGGCQGASCGGYHRRYDPQTNTWTSRTPLPANIGHLQAVATGGLIYYIGGITEADDLDVDTVYIYNPVTNTFSTGTPMPAGRSRGSSGVAVHNGKIYVAGGLQGTHETGTSTAMFDVYDPGTNAWTTLPNLPVVRDHVQAVVIGTKLYLVGGRNTPAGMDALVARVDVYDLVAGSWSTLPASANLPTLRAGAGTVAVGNEVVILGGETASGVPGAVEALNVTSQTWRTLAPMDLPRHGMQATTCANGIYVAGGSTQPQYTPTTRHDVLQLNGFGPCPKP